MEQGKEARTDRLFENITFLKEAAVRKFLPFLLVLLALALVLPVSGRAGAVSSKYDVTFGGFVKYDLGYSTQNNNSDATYAYRHSSSDRAVLADEYGNTFATAAETRFSFLVKGPDLWGAKTSAFIQGDFRGTGDGYGGYTLKHAFLTLKWPSTELLIGQGWQQWGTPYYGAWIGANDFTQYLAGVDRPQIAFRHFFTKEVSAMFGLISATDWAGQSNQYNDGYARSSWPGLQGEIAYWSDRCGRIGANNLKLGLGGYYGRDRETYTDPSGAAGYKDSTINAWVTAFRYSVPIVPERKGNKTMSLLLNGSFFMGQNVGGNNWMGGAATSNGSYLRPDNDATAPTVFGLFTQASWWLTDNLWLNGMYGYLKYNYSGYARTVNPGTDRINMMQTYATNLLWDANESLRFGLQWMLMFNHYNGVGTGGTGATGSGFADASGTVQQYRFAAWYFF